MNKSYIVLFVSVMLTLLLVVSPLQARLVFGPDTETAANDLDNIVAVVDDDIITRSELNSALAIVSQQLEQGETPLPPQDILERQVLERLILTKLQLRAAEQNGVVVDDSTLNAAIERLARSNKLTLSQLREAVQRDGVNFADFREQIREEILATRLRQRVVDSQIQISEQEVDSVVSNQFSRGGEDNRDYHVAQILVAVPEGASPDQIQAARNKAQDVLEKLREGADFKRLAVAISDGRQALEGGDLGWRKADQLPTLFADVVPQLQVGQLSDLIRSPSGFHIVKLLEAKGTSEPMVTRTRVRHILIEPDDTASPEETQLRLRQLKQRVEEGEDFAELARAHSDDSTSAFKGGDLGWISEGDMMPEFEAVMDRLEPGQVSAPLETRYGWHLVQVINRRQEQGGDELQRANVRRALLQRRAEEEWDLWLRRLRDEAYVEIRLPELERQASSPESTEQSAGDSR